MSEWKEVKFKDIVRSMQLGTNALGKKENIGVPLLKMGNLTIGGFNLETCERLEKLPYGKLKPYLLSKGDFLFNTRNTLELVGKSAVWNNQLPSAAFNSNVMRIKFKEEADDFFIGYYFANYDGWNELKKVSTGTTSVAAIYSRDLLKCKLRIPSLPVQRKIARILSTIDGQIEKTEAIIVKYQAIKQGMLQDLFTRGIDVRTGQLRPRYEDAPNLYKESALGMIPAEWEVKPLHESLELITYGFTNPMPEVNDGPYLITAANIYDGVIQYGSSRKTSHHAFENLLTNKSRPKVGDILITKDGTLGRLALVDRSGICVNQSVAVMRCKSTVNRQFLKLLLESDKYQDIIMGDSGGSTIKHIYITVIDKMLIGTPKSESEQNRIADIISLTNNKLRNEKATLSKLQLLKQGLMQDLLSGKVEVEA